MARVNSLLAERMQKQPASAKMAEMAKQSATGHLTSFSGMFRTVELTEKEKENLEILLIQHAEKTSDIQADLAQLILLTSEVRAINNQAALLHGERIKLAHQIFIRYQDNAFTTWLIQTYGNRQTPYNFMQYYEFCEAMPKQLRPQIEIMPRQAIYALASRKGSLEKKQLLIEKYQGETKAEMLSLIRQNFPLEKKDKRQTSLGEVIIQQLETLCKKVQVSVPFTLSEEQKIYALKMLQKLRKQLGPL